MDANFVSSRSKQIEGLLRAVGAEGRGLRELMKSAGLDADTERHCRRVAAIRNKVIHDADFVPNPNEERRFTESADHVVRSLKAQIKARAGGRGDAPVKRSKWAVVLTALGVAAAALAVLIMPSR